MQCPPEQWLKFNVDAAWDEDIACVVVVARNSTGEGSKAWVENTKHRTLDCIQQLPRHWQ